MCVITNLQIENKLLNLEDNIKKLRLSHSLFDFQIIIYDSIKLLSSISQIIKNKNNSYGKHIQFELLVKIITFLSYEYNFICKNICKPWLNNLKKKLFSIPKSISYCKSFKLIFISKTMTKVGDNIYISDNSRVCKIDTKESKIIKINNTKHYKNYEF